MPKHEFGIMQKEPSFYEHYDTYEPQKYNCIVVVDVLTQTSTSF